MAGHVVGTPEYMAPEQCTGEPVDHRVDLYAAGCVLYECLVGEPPLTADSAYQIIARLLSEVPVPVRDRVPEVPAALDALITRCLAKDPLRRPASAQELRDALTAIID
jgi:serine/threonine protein kinase